MALFKNSTHQEIWIDHHCRRCWHGRGLGDPMAPQCPILTWAVAHGRKPREWDRNTKAQLMKDTIRCNSETDRPPRVTKPVVDEDVPMFDVEPVTKSEQVDHA
jgi:hypothetical protein